MNKLTQRGTPNYIIRAMHSMIARTRIRIGGQSEYRIRYAPRKCSLLATIQLIHWRPPYKIICLRSKSLALRERHLYCFQLAAKTIRNNQHSGKLDSGEQHKNKQKEIRNLRVGAGWKNPKSPTWKIQRIPNYEILQVPGNANWRWRHP